VPAVLVGVVYYLLAFVGQLVSTFDPEWIPRQMEI
jgi:hypothetical protein